MKKERKKKRKKEKWRQLEKIKKGGKRVNRDKKRKEKDFKRRAKKDKKEKCKIDLSKSPTASTGQRIWPGTELYSSINRNVLTVVLPLYISPLLWPQCQHFAVTCWDDSE